MKVAVKLFAGAREAAGSAEVTIEIGAETSVAQLRGAMAHAHPSLRPLLDHALFAIDAHYVDDESIVPCGAEIACIPPVSGG